MPNWCTTNYVIKGEPSEIAKIKAVLDELETFESPIENDFGKLWLGNLLCLAGKDPLNSDIRCRGLITYVDYTGEDELILDVDTAWAPMNRVIREYLIKDAVVGVTIWSEEPGMGFYASSEKENIGKYHLELETRENGYITGEDGLDPDEMYRLLKKELGDKFSIEGKVTAEAVDRILQQLEDKEEIEWYSLHEITEISFCED